MKKLWKFTLLLVIFFGGLSAVSTIYQGEKPVYVPPGKQRVGDAKKGYDYLVNGDYVKGGIPYDIYLLSGEKNKKKYLQRDGLNSQVGHEFTTVTVNGQNLVAPNCLQCHAQVFNDRLIIGMGNSLADFSQGKTLNPQTYTTLENLLKARSPQQYEASKSFIKVAKTIGPYLSTQVRGVNVADRLAMVLAAHRDPVSFRWSDSALLEIPTEVIPSDVPAWWLLKKKNAMFYNGFGRGDFGRFLMASNLLTVNDSSESRNVDNHIPDVLAYIYSLEAPAFPGKIDLPLATKGRIYFNSNCSKCHGTYGPSGEYPNLLIPSSIIKTDSALFKSNYQNPQFVEWFNKSWFAQGDHPARLAPSNGYIAPPLDGVWATAPYFHNGSVPTLEAIINSKLRPDLWQRDFNNFNYNFEKPGWAYTVPLTTNSTAYNTKLNGYGNYGHTFGDKLTEKERNAILEYLKTL